MQSEDWGEVHSGEKESAKTRRGFSSNFCCAKKYIIANEEEEEVEEAPTDGCGGVGTAFVALSCKQASLTNVFLAKNLQEGTDPSTGRDSTS